ncbi:uncharacterized protein N7477_006365 [Penicillium maclennaniae]|uniref:uncharacterized protein n=1 Tax=Penicillium maclennaniae TaxID=1343394 RepID=UPI00254230DA|nr:uncharacterized protein N7477_006365 [Penicillium maclennaniae]KAJ5667795.1 hypothetical protein N7477_006365 [Penicillium maclennaniae]
MKFSIAALAGFAIAISAASLPAAFTLVGDGGQTVLTDGTNAYVGGDTDANHEILILRSGPNGMVSFTSKNSTPTGFQNLYVIPDTVEPIALTVPHSGATPQGASTNDFGVNDEGYFTHNGKAYFAKDGYGESKVKELFWYGSHNAEYEAANLYVKECKGC